MCEEGRKAEGKADSHEASSHVAINIVVNSEARMDLQIRPKLIVSGLHKLASISQSLKQSSWWGSSLKQRIIPIVGCSYEWLADKILSSG